MHSSAQDIHSSIESCHKIYIYILFTLSIMRSWNKWLLKKTEITFAVLRAENTVLYTTAFSSCQQTKQMNCNVMLEDVFSTAYWKNRKHSKESTSRQRVQGGIKESEEDIILGFLPGPWKCSIETGAECYSPIFDKKVRSAWLPARRQHERFFQQQK